MRTIPVIFFIAKTSFSHKIVQNNQTASLTADECNWWDGDYGVPIQCPPGTVARGACGSGRRDDCSSTMRPGDKTTTQLYCCRTKYQNDIITSVTDNGAQDCNQKHKNEGDQQECSSHEGQMKPIFRLCGSGMNSDCKGDDGHHWSFTMDCCYTRDLEVAEQKFCVWSYGNYGNSVKCPNGYLAAGYCGSGKNADCPGDTYFGVFCCPYTDVSSDPVVYK